MAELILFLLTAGCIVGLGLMAAFEHRYRAYRLFNLTLMLTFVWLLVGDILFLHGYSQFVVWPLRPMGFRGGAFLAICGFFFWTRVGRCKRT